MHFKLTYLIALFAIAANAAPVTMEPNGVVLGGAVSTSTAPPPGGYDRQMTDTASVNTDASCGIAFHSAHSTILASNSTSATLTGLISQTKAITSLASMSNLFKSLWPGYSTTIAPEFKPFAGTLLPTDATCKGQLDVCLSSLLSTSKLIASSPSGAAVACSATK